MLYRDILHIEAADGISYADITDKLKKVVKDSKIKDGMCSIFVNSDSSGIMIIRHEKLLLEDFKNFFRSVNETKIYAYPRNAPSHLRSIMLPCNVDIPVANESMIIGNRAILLWEFGTRGEKEVVVTISL